MKIIKLLIVIVTIALLTALFVIMRPHKQDNGASSQANSTPATRKFQVQIIDGRLSGTDNVFKVKQNETVMITATSNTQQELHLHGYDKELELEPDKSETMSFKADRAGNFTAEIHSTDTEIFALEVSPQ